MSKSLFFFGMTYIPPIIVILCSILCKFFFKKTASASLHFRNLTIIRQVLSSLWHAKISILSIFILISLTTRNTKLSESLLSTLLELSVMSEHSLLEYCSSLCCCLLKSASVLLVFWNASYKIFDVFRTTSTLLAILHSV